MQSVYFSRFTSLPVLALFPIVDWKSEENCDLFMALFCSVYKIWNEMENNSR